MRGPPGPESFRGWRIHAYALMGNHYHLLLQTPKPNLVAEMEWLQAIGQVKRGANRRCEKLKRQLARMAPEKGAQSGTRDMQILQD